MATSGRQKWAELALERAVPSALATQPDQMIVQHAPALDVCTSRNVAAQAAETDWLCFLDADDELDPGYLAAMRTHMRLDNVLLAPYVSYVHAGTMQPPLIPNAGGWPDSNDAVTGTLIRSDCFDELGRWDHTYWPWSDWELWLRAAKAGVKRLHIPEAVYICHETLHGENLSTPLAERQALHRLVKTVHRQVWER